MSKLKVLVTAEVIREKLQERFSDRLEFVYDGYHLDHRVMPHDELCRKVKGVDVLVCEYDTISRDVLAAADRLRLIVCCRGGVKSVIDLEAAREKGVTVCNNAGRNAGAVTDLAMSFILDLTRHVTLTSNLIHAKELVGEVSTKPGEYRDTVWGLDNDSPFIRYRGRSVCHMTLGIVGFGNAGRALALKAAAFGMKVIAYSPHLDDTNTPSCVEHVSFDELLAKADVVSVHCSLTPQTRDMFTGREFQKMKRGAYSINTARGEIVVEEDLVDMLKSGHLAGAALDTLCTEPLPADSPLIGVKNLLITPHIAGAAYDVQACGTQLTAASLTAWLEGRQPAMCVA